MCVCVCVCVEGGGAPNQCEMHKLLSPFNTPTCSRGIVLNTISCSLSAVFTTLQSRYFSLLNLV